MSAPVSIRPRTRLRHDLPAPRSRRQANPDRPTLTQAKPVADATKATDNCDSRIRRIFVRTRQRPRKPCRRGQRNRTSRDTRARRLTQTAYRSFMGVSPNQESDDEKDGPRRRVFHRNDRRFYHLAHTLRHADGKQKQAAEDADKAQRRAPFSIGVMPFQRNFVRGSADRCGKPKERS